ncbi:hypothetical protein D3C85_1180310 [compost metagenome]
MAAEVGVVDDGQLVRVVVVGVLTGLGITFQIVGPVAPTVFGPQVADPARVVRQVFADQIAFAEFGVGVGQVTV